MKSIQDYINEALIGKRNIDDASININNRRQDVTKFRTVTFDWPMEESCLTWKQVKVEKPNKFVVYYDKYHKCKHIASFGGWLDLYLGQDFEDFSPSDLIKSFKTLKEAVEWAVKDSKVDKKIWDETPNKYSARYCGESLPGYYDSVHFCKCVIDGNIENSYEDTSLIFPMFATPSRADICNTMSNWANIEYDYTT